jgi:putative mRNA 3-end processing factor
MKSALVVKDQGLFCPSGNFFIDAWAPVPLCVITHAHGDHAIRGHGQYICADSSVELLKYRLGNDIPIQSYPYKEKFQINNCDISLHSAGHILGSAQVRIETDKGICVVSGDYKRAADATCEPFELIKCDLFVTESTFALPIYKWEPSEVIAEKMYRWWMENRSKGLCSVLYGYSLGKAQRIMSLLKEWTNEPIYLHGAILPLTEIYSRAGVSLPPFLPVSENKKGTFLGELILAPPMAKGTPWLKRFYPNKSAFASGWMQVRGAAKQRNVDQGFILSDHADWPELITTIKETGASEVLTTHGSAGILARYLNEIGIKSRPLEGTEILEKEES